MSANVTIVQPGGGPETRLVAPGSDKQQTVGVRVVAIGVVFAALAPDPPGQGDPGTTRRAVVFGGLAGLSFGASLYATGRLGSELALGWAVLPPRIVGLVLIVIPLAATARLRQRARATTASSEPARCRTSICHRQESGGGPPPGAPKPRPMPGPRRMTCT